MSESASSAATTVNYEGAKTIASFGDAGEWELLDEGAALIEAGWRRFFCATGEERRDFLQGQTTANVAALGEGDGCAALTLTAQGRPLAMFALYELADRIWISTTAAQAAVTKGALSRFLVADDCEFGGVLDARCTAVAGPKAADVLAAAGIEGPAAISPWAAREASIAGQSVLVFSRDDLRVPCFDVLACDRDGKASDADTVIEALGKAGAGRCGVTALETVRVESGTARYGLDVDETRIALEARLEWAIHFNKGCYVGQEVIERAVSRGRINHEMSLLAIDVSVRPGAMIAGGGENDVVTSVVVSPRHGSLALAYLPRVTREPGSSIQLRSRQTTSTAVIQEWPRARALPGRD